MKNFKIYFIIFLVVFLNSFESLNIFYKKLNYFQKIKHLYNNNDSKLEIVNGYNITIAQAPYQVAFFLNDTDYCGGVIIDTNFILTAAHCVIMYVIHICRYCLV